jgi:hypothetical protein
MNDSAPWIHFLMLFWTNWIKFEVTYDLLLTIERLEPELN